MIIEIVILVILGGGIVVLKIFHSESERKRRLEREQRKIRDMAATGGFATKKWKVEDEAVVEEELREEPK